ncbi:condensin complex subunit 3 isoform X2 [Cydia strobilella]|uniref:condensin complex subunit 3 isoform X2 n=1 Tax=Cydia strobilella TaxID=1100964 RepID=UPI003003AD34
MPPTDADVLQSVNMNKPKPNPKNDPTMFQIFQNVQYNIVQHKKYAKEMTKLYKKMDEQLFRESFKNALMYLFTFGDTSPNVDRVVKFVATFCTTLDDEEEFLLFIINIIFDCQCVSGQSVRYRASQLLEAVLSALGEDASLDEDLCTKLLQSQMQRLQDTRGAVRCRAALALQRLQDPMDPDDEVTRAYKFHMSCDPSASVRRAIVSQIAKCTRNVPYVLERLCDVDEAVRRAAFMYIANVNVTQLRVRQRVHTLKVGLSERSTRVRRVVEEILIPGWLSTFKGNIIDLLKAIRLDNAQDAKDSQYVAGKLLESLFKRLPISELLLWLPTEKTLRLIPAEKLNKETAWYWRYLAEHLQKIDDDETLEMVLPDLVVLIGYIRAIVESPCPSEADDPVSFSTRQYVLHELGSMLRVYDTDPPGRAALQDLITDVLTGDYGHLSADVIRPLVSALELVFPELSPRMEVVCGVISALRDPPEPEAPPPPPAPAPLPLPDTQQNKMKRARLRVSLNVAIEAQEDAVREENYALAAECKAKVAEIQKQLEELEVQAAPPPPVPVPTIKEKVSDAATLIKCLTILNAALDTPQLKTVTPMLRTIFNELEVDIFQNPDIVEPALETVALFGMLDKNFAKDNKAFLFANLIDTSNESVVLTVLRCIVDLLCVHGVRVFEDEESQDDSKNVSKSRRKAYLDAVDENGSISESILSMSPAHSTVIELLLKIMDSPCATYRLIIVEGLCRLLHLGQIESPSILSRLMLLWFNPATVEEDLLRQTIGVFFQTFPANVEGAQEQIQKATLPTLRTLANAPSSSPLSEIDQEAVVRFIASLTRINHELADSQGSMAMLLCSYLVRHPSSSEVGLACRMLALLSPPRDAHQASVLANMLKDLCLKLPDKQSTRNLTRYLGAIEASERLTMNKMCNAEGTMQADDTTFANIGGRVTTSLPTTQPLARSTHVVVNDTVEEEVEIDETSPTEVISKITEESTETTEPTPVAEDNSPESIPDSQPTLEAGPDSDSSGVSPIKKAKVNKGKKKKLSITRKGSDTTKSKGKKTKEGSEDTENGKGKGMKSKESSEETENVKDKGKKSKVTSEETENVKGKGKKTKETTEESAKGGIKRSRSQRSVADVDRAQKAKATKSKKAPPKSPSPPKSPTPPLKDIDTSNITVRKSRGLHSSSSTDSDSNRVASRKSSENVPVKGRGKGKKAEVKGKAKGKKAVTKTTSRPQTRASTSSRSSTGSFPPDDDSADETELHTIVYDNELQQSLLNDSSELADSRRDSRGNVTIPETPEGSDMSDSEPEEVITKPKGKRK